MKESCRDIGFTLMIPRYLILEFKKVFEVPELSPVGLESIVNKNSYTIKKPECKNQG
jgi:hypothetical protein